MESGSGVCGIRETHPRTVICGISFSCLNRDQASKWLLNSAYELRGGYICVTGAHGVILAQDDPEFLSILNSATMNTLDGQPVVWISRWRGHKSERVTGRELLWDTVAQDRDARLTHVLFGSTREITDKMIERLRKFAPTIQVQAFNPPFTSLIDDELDEIVRGLQFSAPAIIWVGLSTPKQERLAARLAERLPRSPVVAIGAGFNFIAGVSPVAPRVITALGLEWLFRLSCEPRRLYKRYVATVPRFSLLFVRELLKRSVESNT